MDRSSHMIALLFIIGTTIPLIRCIPTVVPFEGFDAQKDAQAIHDALMKDPVDSTIIQDILGFRVCTQRMEISKAYLNQFKRYIIETIAERTGETYEQILKDSFVCDDLLRAVHLRRALKKGDNKDVTEILVACTETAEKHNSLLDTYKKVFIHTCEDDIREFMGGDVENVLLEIVARTRQALEPVDEEKARKTAEELNEDIDEWGDDRQFLDETLMETNLDQLNLVFKKFKEINGRELEEVIGDAFDGSKKFVYRNLMDFCKSFGNKFVGFFANRVMDAVEGHGTNEQTLIRVTLLRSEIDLKEISDYVQQNYQRNMIAKTGSDISGPFESLLHKYMESRPPS